MEIREITTPDEKQRIARFVLESLPDWFGIPEAREEYIEKSAAQPFFAAQASTANLPFTSVAVVMTADAPSAAARRRARSFAPPI